MKIRIVLDVDIDEQAWCAEYGDEPHEVAESVRSYVLSGVASSAAGLSGCFRDVSDADDPRTRHASPEPTPRELEDAWLAASGAEDRSVI